MMQFLSFLFAATLASCVVLGSFQPSPCLEDSQCYEGYFCETTAAQCQKCLSCQNVNREPPPSPNSCIKLVRECGPCLKGLVQNHHSDINCLHSETIEEDAPADTKTGVWVTVGIVVVLVLVGAAATVGYYVSRNKKNTLSKVPDGENRDTNTSITLPSECAVAPEASAPDFPPAYSPSYDQMSFQPISEKARRGSDEDRPLIPLNQPPEYESQNNQQVSMFNKPNYVHYHNDSRSTGGRLHPTTFPASNGDRDENHNDAPSPHDEEATMPSDWTATPQQQNDTDGSPAMNGVTTPSAQPQWISNDSAGNLSTALAIARNTELIRPRPETLQLQTVDGNESSNYNAFGASGPRSNNNIFLNVNIVNK